MVRLPLLLAAALMLSSCALSHGPGPGGDEGPGDPVGGIPAPLVGDWTFAAPICDSFNRIVWISLCSDGTAWLSEWHDYPSGEGWSTFPRRASAINEHSVRFERVETGNFVETSTLEMDVEHPATDRLIWVEWVGDEWGCGVPSAFGERGSPEYRGAPALPSHPCP